MTGASWAAVIGGGIAAGVGGFFLYRWLTKKPAPKQAPNGGSIADPRRTVGQLPLPQGASRTTLPNNRDASVTAFRRTVSQGNMGPGNSFTPYGALPARTPAQQNPDQGQLQTVGQLGAIGLQGVVALTPAAIAAWQKPSANEKPLAIGPRGTDDPAKSANPTQGLEYTGGTQSDAERQKAFAGDYVRYPSGDVRWVSRDSTEAQLSSQGLYRGSDGIPRYFDAAHPDPRLSSSMADAADFSAPSRPGTSNPYGASTDATWDGDPGIARPPQTVDPIEPNAQNSALPADYQPGTRLPADYSGPMPQGYQPDPFSPSGMSLIPNPGDAP